MKKKNHSIIDGGPSSCGREIAYIMEDIMNHGETMDLMLTHIDQDHIEGLTNALQIVCDEEGTADLVATVGHFFFNTVQEYQRRKKLPVSEEHLLVEDFFGDASVPHGIELLKLLESIKLADKLVYSMQGDRFSLHVAELFFISPGEKKMEALNSDKEKYMKDHPEEESGDCAGREEPEPFVYPPLADYKDKELSAKEKQ